MRISEFGTFIRPAILKRRRVLAVGKPGVGKTFSFGEACRGIGHDLIVLCLPLDDPSTIRGYPRPPADPSGDAVHCLFDGMARAFRATRPTLVLADDIGQASESTLKAFMRILQFGELDGRKLPECVSICAATNDVGHGAGVYGMIEPLKSRFHTILQIETHVDDVAIYGYSSGWPAWLIAFLRNSPDALHDWKPSKSMSVDGACPRGWEYLAEWDNLGVEDPEVWAGCVGKGRATAASAFKRLINDLPDVDAIMMDPDGAPVPEDPAARYLVSSALSAKITANTFGQVVKYLNRLPQMFRAYSIRDAFQVQARRRELGTLPAGHQMIHTSRDFTAWVASKDGKEVNGAAD